MKMFAPGRAGLPWILVLGLASSGLGAAQTPYTEHTLSAEEGVPRPETSVSDLAWMTGHWVGEGLGATAETVWLPPVGHTMVGVFRLVREGTVEFYELLTYAEDEGSLTLRLKHFGSDLIGWEERGETVSFPLLRREADMLWFDGLTIQRVQEDRKRIWVALQDRKGRISEALFEYRRVSDDPRIPTSPGNR